MRDRSLAAGAEPDARHGRTWARATVRRGSQGRPLVSFLVLAAAAWGWLVDANLIPILTPTSNSTILQATTAAAFALLGILFGPLAGAMGGLVRDGSGHLALLLAHPGLPALEALLRAIPDILEDVMLGLIPGLVGLFSRRLSVLVGATAGAAWVSLPFLEVGNALVAGQPSRIWTALTAAPGDWNEPVDPGLTVYALLAAGMAALAIWPWTSNRRVALVVGVALLVAGGLMIALGAHE